MLRIKTEYQNFFFPEEFAPALIHAFSKVIIVEERGYPPKFIEKAGYNITMMFAPKPQFEDTKTQVPSYVEQTPSTRLRSPS